MTPKQEAFLCLNVGEALYGGAAGGAKSWALLMGALQYVDVPNYSALLLRQTFRQLSGDKGLIDTSKQWLSKTAAKWNGNDRRWTFPSGATCTFGYLDREDDKYEYQSNAYQYIAFDELTQHPTSKGYTYMFSRLRQPMFTCEHCDQPILHEAVIDGEELWVHDEDELVPGLGVCDGAAPPEIEAAPDGTTVMDIPLRMRAGTNPGGRGEGWVYPRFVQPWEQWREDPTRYPKPKRVFIPARLKDNPFLNRRTYEEQLAELEPDERDRLLRGLWKIKTKGPVFARSDFEGHLISVTEVPEGAKWVRYWDMAATEPSSENPDPDWSVGILCAMHAGVLYIVDVVRFRKHAAEGEKIMRETAEADGKRVPIRMEQEPGASGKNIISHYSRTVFLGFSFEGIPSVRDKVTRAKTWSPKVRRGEVFTVEADWNDAFFEEAVDFKVGCAHDDQVDGVSGAFEHLAGIRRKQARLIV